jgi:hypothetical protein
MFNEKLTVGRKLAEFIGQSETEAIGFANFRDYVGDGIAENMIKPWLREWSVEAEQGARNSKGPCGYKEEKGR